MTIRDTLFYWAMVTIRGHDMLHIKNVSVRALTVAMRWARIYGRFPNKVADLTQEHSDTLQHVAEEYDRRDSRRASLICELKEIDNA